MDIAIRYHSRAGYTKKLAEAIAEATGAKALTADIPIERHVDILFIGASLYYEGIHLEMRSFLRSVDNSKVKKAYIFAAVGMTEDAYPELRRALKKQGIDVADEEFRCWVEHNGLYVGKPDAEDLENVKRFALAAIEKERTNRKGNDNGKDH